MKKTLLAVVFATVFAAPCLAQDTTASSWLKNVGKAAVDAGVQQAMTPQAKATVDQAQKLATPQEKENFLLAKAQGFLGSKNYETAMQLANYVKTNLDAKSLTADKVIADARAAIAKYGQDKMNQATAQANTQANQATQPAQQVKSDVEKTTADVKSILGSFQTKK